MRKRHVIRVEDLQGDFAHLLAVDSGRKSLEATVEIDKSGRATLTFEVGARGEVLYTGDSLPDAVRAYNEAD